MKITLFEDEYALRTNLKDFFSLHSYAVESYGDGDTFLEECRFDSDLYILDINVPGASGYEAIEWITRNDPGKPVIFMTAYTDIDSIAKAYRLGCSDYLKKPFDLLELLLRAQKLLSSSAAPSVPVAPEYTFDLTTRHLSWRGAIVNLSKNQRAILDLLSRHRNAVVTYEMLIDHVWENKYIKFNTIASHIREIRHMIPGLSLQNIRGEGYILKA